jgi:hypothetical protein
MNAQRLILHCMNVAVLGTNFFQFREAIEEMKVAAVKKSDLTTWYQIRSALHIVDLADRKTLIDMLKGTFHLKSSRIHDRLYVIMHLADDFQENGIEVDYNKKASQVMLDVIDHHIRLHRNLRFLDASYHTDFDKTEYLEHNSECSFPTWVSRRWLGSNLYGMAITSFQKDHGQKFAVGEQLDDDEDSSGKIFSNGKYAHNKRTVEVLTKFPDQKLFTTCAPDSVDMTHTRLRVRGMKVGEIRTVLLLPLDDDDDGGHGMTVAQFWSSSLGQHIGSYFCLEERQIPLDMVRALVRAWSIEKFNYEDAVLGLKWFYDCSTKPDLADCHIGWSGYLIDALPVPQRDHITCGAVVSVMTHIVTQLWRRKGILTDKDHFGLVPECNIRAGDEIWMLLGHSIPSVLRKAPNGTYEHICSGRIPVLMDSIVGHTDIRRFSTKAAPGEQIGEWTIEDIELV